MANNNKISCIKCRREFTVSAFGNHNQSSKTCVSNVLIIKGSIRKTDSSYYPPDLKCLHCGKICKNKNSYINHTITCPKNEDRRLTPFMDDEFQRSMERSNQYIKAEKEGLPKPICSEETKDKHRRHNESRTEEWHRENGKKISAAIIQKIINDEWHFIGVKKNIITYYNGIAFHSSWEVKYAQCLDYNNIKWERNRDWFPYEWNGKEKKYLPDFYLPESDEYIEIKGRKLPIDDAKWSHFPSDKKLSVLMKPELNKLGIKV